MPLTMEVFKSRDTLSLYIYNLHETVNTMLGKQSGLTFEDVRERYEHFRSRCLINPKKNIETGCTEPLYGIKSKCVLNIVPIDGRKNSFKIDPLCKFKRKNTKKLSKKVSKK